ncbi:mechanosensitive ion channel family protein [candidate division TA06 bacterium]|uniref:Mechanosensitive ion channel family protein n=1 Tax=candidate division TA06 bacterium TaxID=2250710 RepID=A0A523UQK9_UNCT6|nr:MAG: mechanosensitive ion channel family protein [candidate division TA06 bacterium]
MNLPMQVILPLAFILGGFLVGLVVQKLIWDRLRRIAARTKWGGDEILISAFGGVVILWFTLAGVYGAVLNVPMSATVLGTVQKVLLILVILSGTAVFAKVAVGLLNLYSQTAEGALPSTSILTIFTKVLIFAVGILIILQSLGISITPMLTAFGIGGLAVALALQDTLANLFSGIFVIASRQVKPGDYVELDSGEKGYVTDVTWRNTTIRALPNNMIIVPNSKLASTIVTNYYQPQKQMSVLIQVGISYDSDLKEVERVTIDVAKEVMKEVKGGVAGHEPFIRYHTFGDSSINFSVILRANEYTDQYLVKHEFIKRLHERYMKEGIEIPFPIRTVHMKGESEQRPG